MSNKNFVKCFLGSFLQVVIVFVLSVNAESEEVLSLGGMSIICTNFAMGVQCDSATPLASPTAGGNPTHRNIIAYDTNGVYALGFHEIVRGEFYLSIYLFYPSDSSAGPPVWTANRGDPVDENATLSFLTTGSLELSDSMGNVKWSTRTEQMGVKMMMFNFDMGKLQLLNEANQTVWQTSDNLADTLVENQVLKYNGSVVTSSTSDGRGIGRYSMAMEAGGLVLYARAYDRNVLQPYRVYSFYGEADLYHALHTCKHPTSATFFPPSSAYSAILQQNTSSIAPTAVVDSGLCSIDPSLGSVRGIFNIQTITNRSFEGDQTRALRLQHDGTLEVYSWKSESLTADNPEVVNLFGADDPCSLPNVCGPYGLCTSNHGNRSHSCSCPVIYGDSLGSSRDEINVGFPEQGCRLPGENPTCEAQAPSTQTQFIELDSVDYFTTDFEMPQFISEEECVQQCLQNCTCYAAFYRSSLGQCFLRNSPLLSLRSANSTFKAYIKIRTYQRSGSSGLGLILSISGVVGVAVLGGILGAGVCIWRRRRKEEDLLLAMECLPGLPPRYKLKDLEKATNGFSTKVGEGGFGIVYKGRRADGTEVAVKRLKGARQGAKAFSAEVASIGSIHHINLVGLCGFCAEGAHRLLVYEFMANGTLDSHLFPKALDTNEGRTRSVKHRLLDWKTRKRIASDTAKGLAYLHEECREQIIHFYIKPQNILLDEQFHAKVVDFGLSKLVKRDETGQVVTHLRGTPGYLAPEWLHMATVTEKADVYSFGMVLLDIVSGRRNFDPSYGSEKLFFPSWGFQKYKTGNLLELFDPRLQGLVNVEEAACMIKVAFWCIQEDPLLRPPMSAAVQMLEGTLSVPEPPQVHGYSHAQETIVNIIQSDCISPSLDSISSDASHRLVQQFSGVEQRPSFTRASSKTLGHELANGKGISMVEAR